ncbi:uncharacterized protein LOC62_02G003107 [Vanrija pseudolonga]|uniref:Uncharacterized protein n=1 Tax=Vanrija pseudolonga TaxID=143232 RepID=A0AAF0Y3X4_9TREE|nr:hypothetical protein LOC62_02G003107 [Vanrija pseudolonga]
MSSSLSQTYTTWITEILTEEGYGELLEGGPTPVQAMDYARHRVVAVVTDLPRQSLASEPGFQNIAFWNRYASFREMHDDVIQFLDSVDTEAAAAVDTYNEYGTSYDGYQQGPHYGTGWY